ncbi:alkylmercury lyase [Leptospira broomii]|uniref:alkylmercury lyase n=1 Tax=Leptospira broomii TaxID=301541 RepID=UPI0002883108|nr:alkylmercury lyase [Leptospira broomii]
MKIELIYDTNCPNAAATKEIIIEVLKELQLPENISEINKDSIDLADEYRQFSSPTILVNDKDIGGQNSCGGTGCRIYKTSSGRLTGVPPKELLLRALVAAKKSGETLLFCFAVLTGLLPLKTGLTFMI